MTILTLDTHARISDAPPMAATEIYEALIINNPKFQEALRHGRYTGRIPAEIHLATWAPGPVLVVPRGYARDALLTLRTCGVEPIIKDLRCSLPPMDLAFKGTLRTYQTEALSAILAREQGHANLPTGAGKTVLACAAIAARKQPTLILVHSLELARQWVDRIKTFLGVEAGLIGNGRCDIRPITVAIINSARARLDLLRDQFGHVVVDECHRTPAAMFSEVVAGLPARFRLGLSATPYRRDGLDKLISWTLGPCVHTVTPEALVREGAILAPEIIRRETTFRYAYRDDYGAMVTALTEDEARNALITSDILSHMNQGTALVVSDRVGHCRRLADLVRARGVEVCVLIGADRPEHRERTVELIQTGAVPVLIATTSLIGEGFDCSGLAQLFLATPIKFRGRLIQVVGRILRPAPGKRAVVFDYVDTLQPVLAAQAKMRWT